MCLLVIFQLIFIFKSNKNYFSIIVLMGIYFTLTKMLLRLHHSLSINYKRKKGCLLITALLLSVLDLHIVFPCVLPCVSLGVVLSQVTRTPVSLNFLSSSKLCLSIDHALPLGMTGWTVSLLL